MRKGISEQVGNIISSSAAAASNDAGSNVVIQAGAGDGTGNGGDVIINAGAGAAKGIINFSNSLLKNVLDPVALQDGATKNYVDTVVSAINTFNFVGGFDASIEVNFPAADNGDFYRVTGTGTVNGIPLAIGDDIICTVDATPLGTPANYIVISNSIGAASETVAGIAEIATAAEVNAGLDNTRIVSPAGLNSFDGTANIVTLGTVTVGNVDAIISAASEILAGKVQLATQVETDTGTNDTKAITPLKLATYVAAEKSSAGNGMTQNGQLIDLGGALTADAIFSGAFDVKFGTPLAKIVNVEADVTGLISLQNTGGAASHEFTATTGLGYLRHVGASDTFTFQVASSGATILATDGASTVSSVIDTNSWTVTGPAAFPGVQYAADYSASFTNRSLVDKEYVDDSIALAGGGDMLATVYDPSNISEQLVGLTATQTLSNKTLDATNNTIANLDTTMFATNVIDIDDTLTANSDLRIPTQQAVKAYVDNNTATFPSKFTQTFVDGDLTAGAITINHNLGEQYPVITIVDGDNTMIIADEITFGSTNAFTLDLSSYGTLVGTYKITVIG